MQDGDATIIEAQDLPRLGPGTPMGRGIPLGRGWRLGRAGTSWADYWVEINIPITRRAADALAGMLSATAPVRCRLRAITLLGGVGYALGRDVWTLGNDVPLGGAYSYGE